MGSFGDKFRDEAEEVSYEDMEAFLREFFTVHNIHSWFFSTDEIYISEDTWPDRNLGPEYMRNL